MKIIQIITSDIEFKDVPASLPFMDNTRCINLESSLFCEWSPEFFYSILSSHVNIRIIVPSALRHSNLEYAVYLLRDRKRLEYLPYSSIPLFNAPIPLGGIDAIQIFVRDCFYNIKTSYTNLLHLVEATTNTPSPCTFGNLVIDNNLAEQDLPWNYAADIELYHSELDHYCEARLASGCSSIKIQAGSKVRFGSIEDGFTRSELLWLYSLDFLGRIGASYLKKGDKEYLYLIENTLDSFFEFVSIPRNREYLNTIPSADHGAASRLKTFAYLFRIIYLCDSITFVSRDSLLSALLREVVLTIDWLSLDSSFHHTNHGIMGCISLLYSSLLFDRELDLYGNTKSLALSRLCEVIESSFCKDGLSYENTIGYHRFILHLLDGALAVCSAGRIDDDRCRYIEDAVLKGKESLKYAVRYDNSIPPIGDSPVYIQRMVDSINLSKSFVESGFAVLKRDDLYLSLICGSRSEHHKQVDDSSITLSYRGVDIFLDAGSYSYARADGHGRYVESSRGHSGVFPASFSDLRRKEVIHSFGNILGGVNDIQRSTGCESVSAWYELQGILKVERSVQLAQQRTIEIRDSFSASSLEELGGSIVQRFLVNPQFRLMSLNSNCLTFEDANNRFTMTFFGGSINGIHHGQSQPFISGWFSVEFGEILPCHCIELVSSDLEGEMTCAIELYF